MFAIRLINLVESQADRLADGLVHEIRNSDECRELVRRVPAEELKRRAYEIYRNLNDWLLTKTESEIEERYVGLGMRRARQGVPFSAFLWASAQPRNTCGGSWNKRVCWKNRSSCLENYNWLTLWNASLTA